MLILAAVLIGHLVEEAATGFRRKFPLGEMPMWVFVMGNVAVYGFCAATFTLVLLARPAGTLMAWVLAVAMALNGIVHIGVMIYRKEYFPGGITAGLVLAAAAGLMAALARG
ncbi:MAG TPA: HXXEE domain-containing protein [candidate division Zixibacteria bacterium]|nr:HXXEE domain-containing protein [candidate division Zixibacteria bacterium]